jgi:RNA polymerase sigma-70 factor (ECF subfamily)
MGEPDLLTPISSEQIVSDLTLVLEIAKGDAESFALFYDRHASMVFGFLCRLLNDRVEAEDALQETFWTIWQQAKRYDSSRGVPVAWLVQIARSRGIDRLRQLRLKNQRDGAPIEEWNKPLASTASPEAMAMEQDTQRIVHGELNKLDMDQREAIILAFFRGLTHQEIANRLGAPLGTIKTRIRLGMRKLQMSIQKTRVAP